MREQVQGQSNFLAEQQIFLEVMYTKFLNLDLPLVHIRIEFQISPKKSLLSWSHQNTLDIEYLQP